MNVTEMTTKEVKAAFVSVTEDNIILAYEDLKSVPKVAKRYEMNAGSVWRILKRNGVQMPGRGRPQTGRKPQKSRSKKADRMALFLTLCVLSVSPVKTGL